MITLKLSKKAADNLVSILNASYEDLGFSPEETGYGYDGTSIGTADGEDISVLLEEHWDAIRNK